MKYKTGDILIDPQDDEKSRVIGMNDNQYELEIIRSGNGGYRNQFTKVPIGKITWRSFGFVDEYLKDETYLVEELLLKYDGNSEGLEVPEG